MTDRAKRRSTQARRAATLLLLLAAGVTLGACTTLRNLFHPPEDAPPCTPRHHAKLLPATEKAADFPYFRADTSRGVATVDFQVCDSIAADLNGDGRAEVVAADHIQPGFGFFVNDPGGPRLFRKGEHVAFLHGFPSAGIAAEDFNGDGIVDVVNSNHPGTVTVRLNETPAGSLDVRFPGVEKAELNVELHVTHGRAFGFADREGGIVSADFNLDGRPDVATANLSQTDRRHRGLSADCPQGDPVPNERGGTRYNTAVLMNRTEAGADEVTLAPIAYFPVPGPAIAITAADFNGDGLPDLVTANPSVSRVSILTNRTRREPNAPACFEAPLQLLVPEDGLSQGAGPTNTIARDFNDDGKPDLASANWNARTVTIWFNTTPASEVGGRPSFSESQRVSTGGTHPLTLRAGDLDGDAMTDLVVFPLSTLSDTAMMVLRNESERGGTTPRFVVDAVYPIPRSVEHHRYLTYFTGAGFVEDFDLDGKLEIGVIVGRGSMLLKAMKPSNNILDYIDPGVPLWTVHPALPHKSGLVIFHQSDDPPDHAVVCRAPEYQGDDFCTVAQSVLGELTTEVFEAGETPGTKTHSDPHVRSVQAKRAAARLRRLVETAPPALREDVRAVQRYIQDAEKRVLTEPSWEADEVEGPVQRVTDYLIENCAES